MYSCRNIIWYLRTGHPCLLEYVGMIIARQKVKGPSLAMCGPLSYGARWTHTQSLILHLLDFRSCASPRTVVRGSSREVCAVGSVWWGKPPESEGGWHGWEQSLRDAGECGWLCAGAPGPGGTRRDTEEWWGSSCALNQGDLRHPESHSSPGSSSTGRNTR